MKVSIVSDEISADPETAFELGTRWKVPFYELRSVGVERVPMLSPFQEQLLLEAIETYQVKIVAISPGLFKFPLPARERNRFPVAAIDRAIFEGWRNAQEAARYHLEEVLPASIQFARRLGTNLIISFGFDRGDRPAGEAPDEVLDILHKAAELVGQAEMTLAIEVEDGHWADTGRRAAELIRAVDHPALKVNWDPGNTAASGEAPFPDGYLAVREYVRHVHVKDVVLHPQGGYHYAVQGDIDWAEQLRALAEDGYDGYLSVETHMRPKVESARAMLGRLRAILAQLETEG